MVVMALSNTQNVAEPAQFTSALGALMGNLTEKVAYASPRKFAAGSVALTPFLTIYGMAQCTRDLPGDDCNRCLATAVEFIPNYCNKKQGGRIASLSCSIRFEQYPFYNASAAEAGPSTAATILCQEAPVSQISSFPSSFGRSISILRTGQNGNVIDSVVDFVPVFSSVQEINRKPHKHALIATVRHGDDEEMRGSEFLLYDLSTLRTATDNFSEENKLGEGGFGPVYKGVLQDGQEIAVKRLSATSQQGQVEMKNEVFLVAKLQHKNLVRILGCCIQEHERLLVYEFLSNNSLDKILFGTRLILMISSP
ncbi:hypothetical protein EJB05_52380, partial [Eragrostis curvula]